MQTVMLQGMHALYKPDVKEEKRDNILREKLTHLMYVEVEDWTSLVL